MTDPALDRLAAFLESPDLDDGVMTLPELDGFLTALAIGPVPVATEEWLPLIWGEEAPAFADDDEAKAIQSGLHTRTWLGTGTSTCASTCTSTPTVAASSPSANAEPAATLSNTSGSQRMGRARAPDMPRAIA